MKPLPSLPLPRAADRSLLPAALCALLAVGLAMLLALPVSEPLPEGGVVRPLRLPQLVEAAPYTDPVIVQRTLFSPNRRPGGGGGVDGVAAAAPLGGARVAGVTLSRGRTRVFMVAADGRLATLAPGSSYDGWRLTGATLTAVRFVRAGERLDLAVGGVAARAAVPAETEEAAEEAPL